MMFLWMLLEPKVLYAARQDMDKMFARYAMVPDSMLLEQAKEKVRSDDVRNALVIYSIVVNRHDKEGASKEERKYLARALNNLGYIYFYHYYDYQKAYLYLDKARKVTESDRLQGTQAYVYLNLGNLYSTLSDSQGRDKYFSEKPLQCYIIAFDAACKAKEWNILQVIYNNLLGNAYDHHQLSRISKERRLFDRLHFPKNTPLVEHNDLYERMISLIEAGHYREALSLANLALESVDTKETPERYRYSILSLQADIYEKLKDKEGLDATHHKMIQLLDKYDIKDLKVAFFCRMSTFYEQEKKMGLAQHYEMLYLKEKDKLFAESHLMEVGEMHFLSELQDATDKVKILAVQRHQQQIVAFLCFLIALIGLAFSIYFVRQNKEFRRKQKSLYDKMQEILRRDEEDLKLPKYGSNKLDDEVTDKIYHKILAEMANVETICSVDLTLRMLADKIDESYKEVSQVINGKLGKNFNTLLGEYRIKEACRRLGNIQQYGNLTIEAIALSVGFKSRTHFVAIFKKVTGLTPSEYQRNAREQNDMKNVK